MTKDTPDEAAIRMKKGTVERRQRAKQGIVDINSDRCLAVRLSVLEKTFFSASPGPAAYGHKVATDFSTQFRTSASGRFISKAPRGQELRKMKTPGK